MTRRIPFDTLMGDKMAQFYLYYPKLDRPQRKIYFDPFGGAKTSAEPLARAFD